jgi:translocation and assembly module TamB
LKAQGRLDQHRVTLQASAREPSLQASMTLAGAYDLPAERWQGQLTESKLTLPQGGSWEQEAASGLQLEASRQQLAQTCWRAGEARLCLTATQAKPETRLTWRLEQLNISAFAALMPEGYGVETIIDGQGAMTLQANLPTELALDLSLAPGRILLPDTKPLSLHASSIQLRQAESQWQASAQLAIDQAQARLTASVPMQGGGMSERPLQGQLTLDIPDLSWLSPLLPGVSQLAGRLEGRYSLAGTLAAPQLDGTLALREGRARVDAAGINLRQIQAQVEGGNRGVLHLNASADSGGTLTLTGQADLADGKPVIDLARRGQNVQVADIADARVWLSPDLRYHQDADGMRLTGTVNVPKAEITPRNLAANAIGVSRDQVLVGADAPEERAIPLSAEVQVVLGEAVSFEGFGLKSRVEGRLMAIDTPGAGGTRGRGELRLVDAAYKAYGQEIQVQTGRILFNGGPITEPTVDIIARRSPREDVSVALHVRGTLDQPTFDLTSSPAMPREQQLGWLLFGRPIDGGAGGELSGAAAALSLGIAGGDALASRIGKVIGLDQVSLGADTTSTAWQSSNSALPGAPGTDQTRFTVGKYLSPKQIGRAHV